MKFSLGLPTHRVDSELTGGRAITDVARLAEDVGFDAVFVTDHPMPVDQWLTTGGHHDLDPFVALSTAAAATTSLRLQTNLLILAYRNPFLSAKAIASLDRVSDGRVIVGVGAGYLEGEFTALGVDFDERNELTDEAINTMRSVWRGESVLLDGRHFHAGGNTALPRPVQPDGPPIWIGGNSKRAIRRAVELGDGWMPMPSPPGSEQRLHTPAIASLGDLEQRLEFAHEHAEAVGRSRPLDVAFMPPGLDMFTNAGVDVDATLAGIDELVRLGVGWATVSLPGKDLAAFRASVEAFAPVVAGAR